MPGSVAGQKSGALILGSGALPFPRRNLAARPKKVARTQSNTLVFTIAAGALANLSLQGVWVVALGAGAEAGT
jgi:hypothetical protein